VATCLLSITSLTSRCSPHTRVRDIACTHPAWQCKCRWLQPIHCGVAPRHWWARGKVRLCPPIVSVSVAYSRRWKDRMVQASAADNATTRGRRTRLTRLITTVPLYPCMHATRPPQRLCVALQQQVCSLSVSRRLHGRRCHSAVQGPVGKVVLCQTVGRMDIGRVW